MISATYALNKFKLPVPKSDAKEVLAYLCASLLVAPLYIVGLCSLHYFSRSWTAPVSIVTIIVMVFILPWLMIALRWPVQRRIDKILYGERLTYREMVHDFPRRMSNVLSLRELAEELLRPIPKALNSPHVSLLLPSNGDFTSQFSNHLVGVEPPSAIKLSKDSPIVRWLKENDKPLVTEIMDAVPQFKKLGDAERNAIRSGDIELLVPVNDRGKLVGILALGQKQPDGSYSRDDIALLTFVSRESAATISNAQLYAVTRERAHTDELTGLLSHGFFHRRVEEEISRCSRFGNIFSVLFLDIDLFKSYNDAFGHLAGDDMLKEIALHIKGAIRRIDIPCRYGGDEFAIILPESSLDDAHDVAERIRKGIETEMDCKGIALTCSIGVAAWPIGGVTREAVIHAADSALYLGKQAGRNRVYLASPPSATPETELEGELEVLSAIHALAATVDAKDSNTYGHSQKASEYAARIAEALGYTRDKIETLKAAALLHDIGKIRVPDRVLLKPGPLTDEEWTAIREHPKFGVGILKHIKGLSGCLPTIQHHHEHFDGSGYPAGLAAENIPIDARILAVADAYDAITSPRPYRYRKLAHGEAIDELLRSAGTHLDPEIVRAFAALWEPLDLHELIKSASR